MAYVSAGFVFVDMFRHAFLTCMAVLVQSFMLTQVAFFYLQLRWRIWRKPPASRSTQEEINFEACVVSVIMMARNEALGIRESLRALGDRAALPGRLEVVMVDSSSTDNTLALAQAEAPHLPYSLVTVEAAGGRGMALDTGVAASSGKIVLVIHADCVVPVGFDASVRAGLAKRGVLATAFRFALNRAQLARPLAGLRVMEFTVNVRARVLQLPFGDQGIAITAARLKEYGGWGGEAYPLMEDFQLVQKLRVDGAAGAGRIEILPEALLCSPRRWASLEVWRVNMTNQIVMIWFRFGASPRELFDFYYGVRSDHVPRWLRMLTAPLMGRPSV